MAISEGTILKVVANLLFSDSTVMQNVFHTVLTSAGGSSDEDDVVDDMGDWVDDIFGNISGFLRANITPGEVTVYQYDAVDDDWDEVGSTTATFTTSNANNLLPRGVSFVINANTTDPDVQGRKYIGGQCEDASGEGVWLSGTITAMTALAADWIAGFVGAATGATFTPGVWSVSQGIFRAFATSVILNAVPGYQRRRKEGVGI